MISPRSNTEDPSRPDPFETRLRRARAWCQRAEAERPSGDLDAAFLFYWIAFNAAYAQDFPKASGERTFFEKYLYTLTKKDGGAIHDTISGARCWPDVASLLRDKHLFLPFWDNAHDESKCGNWQEELDQQAQEATDALCRRETHTTLATLFRRIYTLRNQVAHGGARWNSEYNRDTMKTAVRALESLVPIFITVMENNRDADWGTPHYRVYPIYWSDEVTHDPAPPTSSLRDDRTLRSSPPPTGDPMTTDNTPSVRVLRSKWETIPRDDEHFYFWQRMRRAIQWLYRAVRELDREDPDVAFILYWIAFNAAYADAVSWKTSTTKERIERYFETLTDLDENNAIDRALHEKFSGPVRVLLEDEYCFDRFWDHREGRSEEDWEPAFKAANRGAFEALLRGDSQKVLSILFERLYTLRNQLVHGGARWNSEVNRDAVEPATRIMAFLVPIFIEIMLDNREADWGLPHYRGYPRFDNFPNEA